MRRIDRVARIIQKELAGQIESDLPERLGLVTLTSVVVQADFKQATVYYSCLDANKEGETKEELNRRRPSWQKFLNSRLKMGYVPKIVFDCDQSVENVIQVERILHEIEKRSGKE